MPANEEHRAGSQPEPPGERIFHPDGHVNSTQVLNYPDPMSRSYFIKLMAGAIIFLIIFWIISLISGILFLTGGILFLIGGILFLLGRILFLLGRIGRIFFLLGGILFVLNAILQEGCLNRYLSSVLIRYFS